MKKFLRLPIDEQETRTTKPQTEEGSAVTGAAANGTANASQEPAHIVSDMGENSHTPYFYSISWRFFFQNVPKSLVRQI